jgi:excisionase family DNA binding protein
MNNTSLAHPPETKVSRSSSNRIQPGFATVKDAAAFLNVSEKTVRRLIDRGFFHPSRAIRKILIPISQLEAFYKATV